MQRPSSRLALLSGVVWYGMVCAVKWCALCACDVFRCAIPLPGRVLATACIAALSRQVCIYERCHLAGSGAEMSKFEVSSCIGFSSKSSNDSKTALYALDQLPCFRELFRSLSAS